MTEVTLEDHDTKQHDDEELPEDKAARLIAAAITKYQKDCATFRKRCLPAHLRKLSPQRRERLVEFVDGIHIRTRGHLAEGTDEDPEFNWGGDW